MSAYRPRQTPWTIDDADFFEIETRSEQLAFLLRYAILAPSGHNTQPWSFRITAEGIEVYADPSRAMAIVDPLDRELLMSLGAAITNLRVAGAHFGFRTSVLYQPRPESSLPAALVSIEETCDPDPVLAELFRAIKKRHTNRGQFDHEPIEPEALATIFDLVDEFPETLSLLLPWEKSRAADLIDLAGRKQMANPAFREEIADWLRPPDSEACDGICADGMGVPPVVTPFASWLLRRVDVGPWNAAHDRQLVEGAALLMVVAADDDRTSLVQAGEVLELLLLRITTAGLSYSFLNQPVEVPELRDRLATLAGCRRPPQLLLRVGHPRAAVKAMPRRPLESVLIKG